jgi:hypothetical protein
VTCKEDAVLMPGSYGLPAKRIAIAIGPHNSRYGSKTVLEIVTPSLVGSRNIAEEPDRTLL